MTAAGQAMSERDASALIARADEQAATEARLVDEIAELRSRESEAVDAALREGRQTRGPGSPAEGVRRKREAAERKLVDIREFELPAARKIASEAAAALRAAKLAQAQADARPFDQFEQEAVERIATAYEELLRGYAALADAAEGREEVYERLEADGLLNGLSDNEKWQITRAFQSTVQPFPVSPAALFESIAPAVLEPHAGDPEYAEHLRQSSPIAARFVELLATAREERIYCRCHLRLTETRSAQADYSSTTADRAGGAAGSVRRRTMSEAEGNRALREAAREQLT